MQANGFAKRAGDAATKLGSLVRERRRSLKLSQLELGELAGVGPAFLYQLEHGKQTVRLDKVLAVLDVLGLELHVRAGKQSLTAAAELESHDP